MATTLTLEQMKQFVRDHFEDFVNKRNAAVIRNNMTPDSHDHDGVTAINTSAQVSVIYVVSGKPKQREIPLHKILAVAHSVAHFAAKPAQNAPKRCSTVWRMSLICIRWEYYLADFKTARFNQ